jgi:hypothetical protein
MSNKQSSVVDWIFSQLIEKDLLMVYGEPLEDNDLIPIIKQAKAMRKKEIDESYQEGCQDGYKTAMSYIEKYYNETFNTKEK